MNLTDLFPTSRFILNLEASDARSAIREMIGCLVTQGQVAEDAAEEILSTALARESQASTGIGKGLALPHAKNCSFLEGIWGVLARCRSGVEFRSIDGEPVRIFFLIVSSVSRADDHMAAMRKIALLGQDEKTMRFLCERATEDGIREILREVDDGQF